jgi:hypothetical protein
MKKLIENYSSIVETGYQNYKNTRFCSDTSSRNTKQKNLTGTQNATKPDAF